MHLSWNWKAKLVEMSLTVHISWPVPKNVNTNVTILFIIYKVDNIFSTLTKFDDNAASGTQIINYRRYFLSMLFIGPRQSKKILLEHFGVLHWNHSPGPPIQCCSEPIRQHGRWVTQHWLVGAGEEYKFIESSSCKVNFVALLGFENYAYSVHNHAQKVLRVPTPIFPDCLDKMKKKSSEFRFLAITSLIFALLTPDFQQT